MNESTQIIELLNNENPTFTNISYKAVNRTKINNMNNNSFSNNRIRFNTKELAFLKQILIFLICTPQ